MSQLTYNLFNNTTLLRKLFQDDGIHVNKSGYFTTLVEHLSFKNKSLVLEGKVSIKSLATLLKIHPSTIRKFLQKLHQKQCLIMELYKDKYLDDEYYISIDTKYLPVFTFQGNR